MEVAAHAEKAAGILRALQAHRVGEERVPGRSGERGGRDAW